MADITRKDWVAKTSEDQVAVADTIFAKLNKASKYAYQPGYTNSFIGVRSGAKPCNFFTVTPQKKATVLSIRVAQTADNDGLVEKVAKTGIKYNNGWYAISIGSSDGIDAIIPVLLQAETEFKKEKGEYSLTLHTEMPKENSEQAPILTMNKEGVLSGEFSVGGNKKIRFSKGNLQFNPKKCEFRFAEHQWDIIHHGNENIATNYDGWIDLFAFGTSGYMGCLPTETSLDSKNYPMESITDTKYDWGIYNPISNGGNKEGLWRVLTRYEWEYLFFSRPNSTKLCVKASVNGTTGIIILPDNFYEHRVNVPIDYARAGIGWTVNKYDLQQWKLLEEAGAVFLPCGGNRKGNTLSEYPTIVWCYQSSTILEMVEGQAKVGYASDFYYSWSKGSNYLGFSVRLIQDVK